MKARLTFDFETRSECNLKTAGAYKYSCDPTTQPTCLAFKFSNDPKVYLLNFEVVNRPWSAQHSKLKDLWAQAIAEEYQFSAHNAFFERCIYENILVKRYGWPSIPFRQYRCTAAKAAACALPRNLEGAGAAMRLTTQKDRRGYSAMMATCKPTKAYVAWQKKAEKAEAMKTQVAPPKFLTPESAPEVFQTLYAYCKIDVKTEELLDLSLPDLNSTEQEIWHLNQTLNWRGLRVDIPTVRKIVEIMSVESKKKLKELDTLTMGLVTKPGARKSILDFLALEGIELPDIRAKTVEDTLSGFDVSGDMRRLLEIRQALSKTSTKKYQAFLDRAMPDDRCRDILLYHGASTGRDTGTGIQPHNFPRGAIQIDKARPYEPVENVVNEDAEMLRLLYGESLAVLFSSILRNMIIPSEGCELFVADFSKIEVAVLWYLAGNIPGLNILRQGLDPYVYMAASNTVKSYKQVYDAVEAGEEWALDARQLGKAQVLGCGFGMGWEKFKATAFDQYRLTLTDEQSKNAVSNYRSANEAVPNLWREYERCAVAATVSRAGLRGGQCNFIKERGFLWVELPSGRRLAYKDPKITMRETDWGPRETLEFWAVNSKTKKWGPERTWGGTLTENIVQATARDLMMQASVRLEKAGYKFLLSVHDEGITERKIGEGSLDEFTKIMIERPPWAGDMPVEAKGWKGPRYRK